MNLDPPTLLPYSGNEIVHVGDASGTTTRYGITPGQPVTLTVRLCNREAGIDDTGGPNGGPNVYIQIKDPDSKYQDSQGLEHKVFASDPAYRTQRNNPYFNSKSPLTDPGIQDSGSSDILINGGGYNTFVTNQCVPGATSNKTEATGGGYPGYNRFTSSGGGLFYPGNRGSIGGIEGPSTYLSGTALNSGTAALTDYPIGTISIGRSGGGTNSDPVFDANGKPVTDPDFKQVITNPPGSDPDLFIPWGPEFECQMVNPQFAANAKSGDTVPNDYRSPYYLAGVDDQLSYSSKGHRRVRSPTARTRAATLRPPNGFSSHASPPPSRTVKAASFIPSTGPRRPRAATTIWMSSLLTRLYSLLRRR